MTVYTFDGTLDGLMTAVFDAFERHEQPEKLLTKGEALPLFCDNVHEVITNEEKAKRVWVGLEKRLTCQALRIISVSWLSELPEVVNPLFNYVCKTFRQPQGATSIALNYADPDVLAVTRIGWKVSHEQLRMKQFIRFQKAKDGTYLAVIGPDHNVLPLVIGHFRDRFNDQSWLIYDAKRHYGFYYEGLGMPMQITFENEASVPFNLYDGKLKPDLLSSDDQLFQDLWRTYFKAICIKERLNPRKQIKEIPLRYWKYLTENKKK
ncbi:MAG: TIGR03915 family putative DNA repair protein [Bacteroidales bacterium]|nr:TIGR03915 family putative DNA repair protein [Bacteroidales bacterium]